MSFKNLGGQTTCWISIYKNMISLLNTIQVKNTNNVDALSQQPCQEECSHCHKVEVQADIKLV
jgi:hypothetical protein